MDFDERKTKTDEMLAEMNDEERIEFLVNCTKKSAEFAKKNNVKTVRFKI